MFVLPLIVSAILVCDANSWADSPSRPSGDPDSALPALDLNAAVKSSTKILSPPQSDCVQKDSTAASVEAESVIDAAKKRNMQRESSFRSVILSGKVDYDLADILGRDCLNALKKIYQSGQSLGSRWIVAATRALAQENAGAGIRSFDFYHYTNARPMLDQFHPSLKDRNAAQSLAVRNDEYEQMMLYFSGNVEHRYMDERVLWVAHDAVSSQSYGDLRVRFRLSPKARVWDSDDPEKGWDGISAKVEAELKLRFPSLFPACSILVLQNVIPEDSGVELEHASRGVADGWYKVYDGGIIERTDLCYSKCH